MNSTSGLIGGSNATSGLIGGSNAIILLKCSSFGVSNLRLRFNLFK